MRAVVVSKSGQPLQVHVAADEERRDEQPADRQDRVDAKRTLPEEQAFCLANDDSPPFLPGFFQIALVSCKVEPQITEGPSP